jgi:hypothetical protein
MARHQSGDGFGGVRIDQQDTQIVSLSQSRPQAAAPRRNHIQTDAFNRQNRTIGASEITL